MSKKENRLLTIRQFVESCDGSWPSSEGTVRAIIFDANRKKNNFQTAFKRFNRRVLVDPIEFWKCVDRMQEKTEITDQHEDES